MGTDTSHVSNVNTTDNTIGDKDSIAKDVVSTISCTIADGGNIDTTEGHNAKDMGDIEGTITSNNCKK